MTEPLPIPEIRRRLRKLAGEARQVTFRIENLAREMEFLADAAARRARVKPTAPATSRSMTPELAAEITAYARAHLDMSNQDIAARFDVSAGRVTECLQRADDRERLRAMRPATFGERFL